jgi:hypothetical protein
MIAESDGCLVAPAVFKTVVGLLRDRGWFDSYPLRHFFRSVGIEKRAIACNYIGQFRALGKIRLKTHSAESVFEWRSFILHQKG